MPDAIFSIMRWDFFVSSLLKKNYKVDSSRRQPEISCHSDSARQSCVIAKRSPLFIILSHWPGISIFFAHQLLWSNIQRVVLSSQPLASPYMWHPMQMWTCIIRVCFTDCQTYITALLNPLRVRLGWLQAVKLSEATSLPHTSLDFRSLGLNVEKQGFSWSQCHIFGNSVQPLLVCQGPAAGWLFPEQTPFAASFF